MKTFEYTYNFEPEMYKYILSTNILNKKKDEHKIFKSLVAGYSAKDDKDIQIELLQAQINEMKGMIENAKSNNKYDDEPTQNEKSTDVPNDKSSTKKSK